MKEYRGCQDLCRAVIGMLLSETGVAKPRKCLFFWSCLFPLDDARTLVLHELCWGAMPGTLGDHRMDSRPRLVQLSWAADDH